MLLTNYTNSSHFNHNHTLLMTPDEIQAVVISKLIPSTFSFIGSLFIIFLYLYINFIVKCKKSSIKYSSNEYSRIKNGYANDLIFYLALSELLSSIASFLKSNGFSDDDGNPTIDANCVAQGVLMNFAEMASISWNAVISFSIYYPTLSKDLLKITNRFFYFLLYAFGLPIVLTIGPLLSNSYGPAGAWCWMNTQDLNNSGAWIWACINYTYNWINIIFIIFAVVSSVRFFNRESTLNQENTIQVKLMKKISTMLKFFPVILILCWIFPTINRLYLFITKSQNIPLYCLHVFTISLSGALNACVYSYFYFNKFIPCFKCCKKEGEVKIELENEVGIKKDAWKGNNDSSSSKKEEEKTVEVKGDFVRCIDVIEENELKHIKA